VLSVRPGAEAEEEKKDGDDEENKEEEEEEVQKPATTSRAIDVDGADLIEQINAVVRIKIPKVPKEPELNEDGEEVPDETPESELEDIPFEDKCLTLNAATDS